MATQQLKAWTGEFGNQYIDRNNMDAANQHNQIKSWSRILGCLPAAGPAPSSRSAPTSATTSAP